MRLDYTLLLAVVFLSGCAPRESSFKSGILTIAVSGNVVFAGRSFTNGTEGTFKMVSLDEAQVQCTGRFRYHLPPNGTARYRCSTGESGTLRIRAEENLTGSGQGKSSRGPIEIVFGYSLKQANNRLQLPPGTTLVWYGTDIALIEVVNREDP